MKDKWYIVTAKYPGSSLSIGKILKFNQYWDLIEDYYCVINGVTYYEKELKKYPHLYRELMQSEISIYRQHIFDDTELRLALAKMELPEKLKDE